MKIYTGKTVEEAVKLASNELGISEDDLIFSVEEEKKGLFSKKATIKVFELTDVIEFTEQYIKDVVIFEALQSSSASASSIPFRVSSTTSFTTVFRYPFTSPSLMVMIFPPADGFLPANETTY